MRSLSASFPNVIFLLVVICNNDKFFYVSLAINLSPIWLKSPARFPFARWRWRSTNEGEVNKCLNYWWQWIIKSSHTKSFLFETTWLSAFSQFQIFSLQQTFYSGERKKHFLLISGSEPQPSGLIIEEIISFICIQRSIPKFTQSVLDMVCLEMVYGASWQPHPWLFRHLGSL